MEVRQSIESSPAVNEMFKTIPKHIEERCLVKQLAPRTLFLSKDDPIENIYFVCRGSIRVISEFMNGTIHGFAYVEPGDVIGAMELLSEHATSACTLETLTECLVLTMSVDDFMEWFETDHVFAKAIARMVARKFFPTSYEYGVAFKEEAVVTLGRYIYKVARPELVHQSQVRLEMTRQYLSEELGISTRTVYRALKKLAELECIHIERGTICISKENTDRLKAWLNE